jgi:hypothetical protein
MGVNLFHLNLQGTGRYLHSARKSWEIDRTKALVLHLFFPRVLERPANSQLSCLF